MAKLMQAGSMQLRIAENFEALFYAPLYALQALGFAGKEGLEVDWLPPGGPGGAIDAVRAGAVDATWGGPMRVLRDRDTLPDDASSLVCFGEVVGRDPFMLLMRADAAPTAGTPSDLASAFQLTRLADLRLSVVSEVPTPWQCLQADLRERGVDPSAMLARGCVVQGLEMSAQIDALQAGRVDVIQLFEPHASRLERAGIARVVYSASVRGPCCYTTFIASRAGCARNHVAFRALERALARTQEWIASAGADPLARLIAPRFPTVDPAVLQASVARYLAAGIWSTSTAVSPQGIARLASSLVAGGFVSRAARFEDIVAGL